MRQSASQSINQSTHIQSITVSINETINRIIHPSNSSGHHMMCRQCVTEVCSANNHETPIKVKSIQIRQCTRHPPPHHRHCARVIIVVSRRRVGRMVKTAASGKGDTLLKQQPLKPTAVASLVSRTIIIISSMYSGLVPNNVSRHLRTLNDMKEEVFRFAQDVVLK